MRAGFFSILTWRAAAPCCVGRRRRRPTAPRPTASQTPGPGWSCTTLQRKRAGEERLSRTVLQSSLNNNLVCRGNNQLSSSSSSSFSPHHLFHPSRHSKFNFGNFRRFWMSGIHFEERGSLPHLFISPQPPDKKNPS